MTTKCSPCPAIWLPLLVSLLLGACSMVRMGYDQMQTISYWWLDSYFDFSVNQEAQVKSDLREFHQWHRSAQLPDYADLVAAIGNRTLNDVSPASVCEDMDKVRARLDTFVFHAVPYLARLVRQLSPAQMAHLRHKFAEEDMTWRDKWIKPTAEELAAARFDDWSGRADTFYGDISDEQKAFMKNAIARSAFEPQISWQQRQRQQEDMLASFAKIIDTGASQNGAEIEINALLDRSLHPKDPNYLAMLNRMLAESCVNLAGLHQLTTPKQRIRAQEKLAGYERDFRLLSKN